MLLYSVHGAVAAAAYKTLPYDLQKDLVPVTTAAIFPDVLVAANRVPAKTLPELITWAKANPGSSIAARPATATRATSRASSSILPPINATHVPYKGTGPATQALVAGEIDWVFESLGSAAARSVPAPFAPIVVTSAKRSPAFPDIPTAMESGLAGFEVTSWYGLWVRRRHAGGRGAKAHDAVVKGFADPELKDMWAKLGAEPGGSSPRRFAPSSRRTREVGQGRPRREDHARIAGALAPDDVALTESGLTDVH